MKKDNSTYTYKTSLRLQLLREFPDPVILETHGGVGRIYDRCYRGFGSGVVFEKDPDKATVLAKQRPTWSVYQVDCISALRQGAGFHLPINYLDCDPYGEPWPVIDAFFAGHRGDWPDRLAIVVHDGLRNKLMITGGRDVHSLTEMVNRYGASNLSANYLQICREMLEQRANQHGYALVRWAGYHCGEHQDKTH